MIVTITMNPTVDKSSAVDRLVPEKKLRCSNIYTEAGGGGINVSKALKELGEDSHALFPAGGGNGRLLKQLLTTKQIPYTAISSGNNTRESFNITENVTRAQYRFIMPGEELPARAVAACLHALKAMDPFPSVVVASGSLPSGIPADFYATVAQIVKERGARLILDTSGEPLTLALKAGVFMIKPNLSELQALTGHSCATMPAVLKAARKVLHRYRCEVVVVSMGAAGALLTTRDTHYAICAPAAKRISTSGAGDSMVAGITWMLQQEKSWQEVLQFGVACGTAATLNAGTQLFKKADVTKLYEQIKTDHTVEV